jgi:hypothetical protein
MQIETSLASIFYLSALALSLDFVFSFFVQESPLKGAYIIYIQIVPMADVKSSAANYRV